MRAALCEPFKLLAPNSANRAAASAAWEGAQDAAIWLVRECEMRNVLRNSQLHGFDLYDDELGVFPI